MPKKPDCIKRFWSKVDKQGSDDCWLWTGAVQANGYGAFRFRNKLWYAHRFAYYMSYGTDPDKLLVCHHCDVRHCVNPAHLFLGTAQDNMTDRNTKGRTARGEDSGGAKLTEADVLNIRRMYLDGMVTQAQIADLYGVHQIQISRIVNRIHWRHI